MVAIHKMLKDSFDDSFFLIAMRTSLEDYALVYALNFSLGTRFKRARTDLDLSFNRSFPIFAWYDGLNDRDWTLLKNISLQESDVKETGLFKDEISFTRHYLVPEHKEADYFLKIENDELDSDDHLVKTILAIPKIMTAYAVDGSKLKSKNNLIF
jgi:hypothetical protein